MLILKKLTLVVCAMMAVVVTSNEASAQRGGGRGQQTRSRFELATLPEVQSELKLNDEQKKLATDLLTKQREKRQSAGQGGDFRALREEMAKLNAEFDTQFVAKLDETQQTRMNGLLAQVNGAASLLDAAVAKAIGVSDEQMGKLKSVNESNQAARREAFQSFQDLGQDERRAAAAKLTEKENAALLAALDNEQKKKFEDLKGEVLTIDQAPLRQGRGGQGGGRN